MPHPDRYVYDATLVRLIDGDTLDVELDLGLRIFVVERLRLHGLNAPESRGDERALGLACTDHVRHLFAAAAPVFTVRTLKDARGKFGRYSAVVTLRGPEGDMELNAYLLAAGWAHAYDGDGPMPRFDPAAPYPIDPAARSA